MLIFKAPAYQTVQENSKFADSFFYSYELETNKSMHNLFFVSSTPKINYGTRGN